MAPLNWGLGHATRCIPIINALLVNGHTPIIASDGVALSLLQKEFPNLEFAELPSYKIKYAKKGKNFKLKMIWDSPKILKAMANEKKQTKKLVKKLKLDGIISDNRLGVYSKKVPSIFITHQLNVLTGNTSWMSSKVHQKIISKYTECWVPDVKSKPNLSGRLGHIKNSNLNIKYLGPLSRFNKTNSTKKYDLMILLSGPEPQRTLLEEKLLAEIPTYIGQVLFVKGVIEGSQQKENKTLGNANVTFYNFMQSEGLQNAISESELILCRSGYTTILDLAKMEKKAFFIPTPGQYEQEYLAKRLHKNRLVPYAKQEEFTLKDLEKVTKYEGLKSFNSFLDYSGLFSAFSKVNENSEPTSSTLSI
ncbi:uncharacterized protein (TIGR00661 family) [Saonia flava]|uniref:Uncharacterized protein (TIGR00661 family) n=1 Tax=Saonia flava TaxID=523696 RepID=A0A846R2T8_9FLAO|nr:uncharacterized protein (TIGR00661 family) [Saonia flava]